jgi:hypothetical protein
MPRLLVAAVLANFLSQFLPLHWFRYTDLMIARQFNYPDSPFRPRMQFHSSLFDGDEALAGNLPASEVYAPRRFTTDALGFRYTPPVSPGDSPAILVFRGFSFTWGAGLSDDETFASALARDLGVNVYNGARFHEDNEFPGHVDRLLGRLQARPRLAVYVHLEPNAHSLAWYADGPVDRLGLALLGPQRYRAIAEFGTYAENRIGAWIRESPVKSLAIRANKAVANDSILPNAFREQTRSFTLPNGRPLLFGASDLERDQAPPDAAAVSERADYVAWWKDRLAERGIAMIVLLVPDKTSVYGPSFGLQFPEQPYLVALARAIRARNVRAINGLPLLQVHAADDIASGELAYRREDQHWSALGVARLAEETARVIDSEYSVLLPEHRVRAQAVSFLNPNAFQ